MPSTTETAPYFPDDSSRIIEDTTLDTGLTIKDKNNNEWVWIIVPKSVTASAINETAIYTALANYTMDYRKDGYEDIWYEGCGLTQEEYTTNKTKMLNSIKNYGGFWIGRYELGSDTIRKEEADELTVALVQQDKYPYNYITCKQAQNRCSSLSTDASITSSILYGIQWDLTLKYIEEKAITLGETQLERQEKLKLDSSIWGNYINTTFEITKGKYSIDEGINYINVENKYIKEINKEAILTTGISNRNKVLNIYDIAGNISEWTLEKNNYIDHPSTYRGAMCNIAGDAYPASFRGINKASDSGEHTRFKSCSL